MLKSISLENYKCFKHLNSLDIAPLTILCGVNSSGKSSILKSLLMMKQSYEKSSATNYMTFNGKYIDNGTFNEIISKNSTGNFFRIGNSFEITKNTNTKTITKDTTSFRDLCRLYYDNRIEKFLINISIDIVNSDGFIYSNEIDTIDISILAYKNNQINKSTSIIIKRNRKKYSIKCQDMPDVSGNLGCFEIGSCTCYFSGMSLKSIYQEGMNESTKLYIPTIVSIYNIISTQYLQIKYLAPLRDNPQRRYIADKNVNSVGVTGENTPLLLKKISKMQHWNGIAAPNSEDSIAHLLNNVQRSNFITLLNSWMNYFDLGNVYLDNCQKELIKIKIGNHNIADVGFGVSQSLPILVEGLNMRPEQTLLLEQPEIHLHPKMQMKVADFLLSLAIQNKQVIVETHSDHLINRLVRRYMECKELRNKVKIYFVDKNDNGESKIECVHIDEVDGALCSNPNFFYQFASETEKIIDAGYKNLKDKNV